jgi:ABC-2 type transport system ATP-binding protein
MDEAERLCDRVAVVDHGKTIALGTPRELIASLGAQHVVEFAVAQRADATATLDEAALRALDGVTEVRRDNGAYQLHTAALHRTVPMLLAELEREHVALAELRTHSATLEDVFVALTGRHLRDEPSR